MKPRTVYRSGMSISSLVQEYTSSVAHDAEIAVEVVETALLHVSMLERSGLLDRATACTLARTLDALRKSPERLVEAMKGYEDIHEALEAILEAEAGREAARRFPLARSRNDHVAMALRIWVLRRLAGIHCEAVELVKVMLGRAEEWSETPFPLHTHFQPAQIGTAGHWIHAYAEAVLDALRLVEQAASIAARSTLGSGPGAGTTLPVDRGATPLPPVLNTLYAAGSRLFANAALAAAAVLMTELSRLAADIVLLSHPSIAALRVPEEHVSTSSAMPHKRNPVTAEIARARAARVTGLLAAALSINHGLPHGYNLDLQEENPIIYQALRDTLDTLRVLRDLLAKLEVDPEAVKRMMESGAVLTSLEEAEKLAVEKGVGFRDAYMVVAERVRRGGSVKPLEPGELFKLRVSVGAAGSGLGKALHATRSALSGAEETCKRLTRLLEAIDEFIQSEVARLCR